MASNKKNKFEIWSLKIIHFQIKFFKGFNKILVILHKQK